MLPVHTIAQELDLNKDHDQKMISLLRESNFAGLPIPELSGKVEADEVYSLAITLLRSWLRLHRGISQEKLPFYLGLFEFVYNLKRRKKSLLNDLIELLI